MHTEIENKIKEKELNQKSDDIYGEWEKISVSQADLNKYVSKENGKGLSANDFTDELKNKLEAMSEGGADLTVDSELSETSENPVQNKVIKEALDAKANSSNIVSTADEIYVKNVQTLINNLGDNTSFYDEAPIGSYESSKKRVLFLKDFIENKDGYKLFYHNGCPIKKEKDL